MKDNSHCFKVGDLITRTHRGLTTKEEITIGKSYLVKGFNDTGSEVKIINDYGREQKYIAAYFELAKSQIIYNIIQEL